MTNMKFRKLAAGTALLFTLSVVPFALAEDGKLAIISADGTATIGWKESYASYDALSLSSKESGTSFDYPVIDGQGWVVSGLSDGEYELSLLSESRGDHPLGSITVEHYALETAFSLFTMGFVIFSYLLYTLYKITRGPRND